MICGYRWWTTEQGSAHKCLMVAEHRSDMHECICGAIDARKAGE